MRKLEIVVLVLALLILLFGAGIFFYPTIRTAVMHMEEQAGIEDFVEYREAAAQGLPTGDADEPPDAIQADREIERQEAAFSELRTACMAFNEQLPTTQRERYNEVSLQQPSIRLADYGWTQEIFGYLSIPAAGIETPLYLGASSANMDKGGAILGQTSLPLGGKSTNCVIAGHRTWSGAIRFKGLEQLTTGDTVSVTNPWETLTYRVIETKIVLPDTQDEILVQEGRDLLTLFTCTYPNTRRILVICERTDNDSSGQPLRTPAG